MSRILLRKNILLLDDDLLAAMAAAVAEAEEIIAPKRPKFAAAAGPGVTILPRVSRMPRRIPTFSAVATVSVWAMPSARIRGTPVRATTFSDEAPTRMRTAIHAQLANALGVATRYALGLLGQSIAIPSRPVACVIRARMLTRETVGIAQADARLQVIDEDEEDAILLSLFE